MSGWILCGTEPRAYTGLGDSPIYRCRLPAEIWIAVSGTDIDVAAGLSELPPGTPIECTARIRVGVAGVLVHAQADADPNKAPLGD
ncbi:hypothetical protein ACQPXH_10615 [Nocardia sp. CA-135953]|uniref:hypothetical protein n=1 Tax=Nocardia sp. CA-135953 TaxID=3239978 RepID=UPI003D97C827